MFSVIVTLGASELHLHPFKLVFRVWWAKFKLKPNDTEMGDIQEKFCLLQKVS